MSEMVADVLIPLVPARAGFRLARLEIYNWGTFDERVWHLQLGGDTSLLTGDIGSGKSTIVDALTTLLVPPGKISYNKAAGAEARERSVRSYVLGYFKTERSETGSGSKPAQLRDLNTYSVLLSQFVNEAFDQCVTIAQVFWMKDTEGQPARVFVVADRLLSVADHFSGFNEITALRKRLRALTKDVYDTFPPYQTAFRKRFGIQNEQALELFHQTVSMKSVGNLTEFVRVHMLQPFPVEDRIENLIRHFDDLTRAHEAVLRAKAQIELLAPLVADCDQHDLLVASATETRACRDALRGYIAAQKAILITNAIAKLSSTLHALEAEAASATEQRRDLNDSRDEIKSEIALQGGDRIERLRVEIKQLEVAINNRKRRVAGYEENASITGLPSPVDAPTFISNQALLAERLPVAEKHVRDLRDAENKARSPFEELRKQHEELEAEIASHRKRRSNIPGRLAVMRQRVCSELSIDESDLPFAGELIRVREGERAWEGAIERVLFGFGTSLLVPDGHYAPVSSWIDRTHLGDRLVYLRVRRSSLGRVPAARADTLYRKLAIQNGSPLADWVEAQIIQRHNPVCCDSLEQFRREEYALTQAGQIKMGGVRHVKDDRHAISDRTRFVLGWSNTEKVAALESELARVELETQTKGVAIAKLLEQQSTTQRIVDALRLLSNYHSFADIDWRSVERDHGVRSAELVQLESGSDAFKLLQTRLLEVETKLTTNEQWLTRVADQKSRADETRNGLLTQQEAARAIVDRITNDECSRFQRLDELRSEAPVAARLTIENCDGVERDFRAWLQSRIDNDDSKASRTRDRIIKNMQEYRNAYPIETRDADASIQAANEYRQMLATLRSDDLPRFEARFKELLNENTIREVANFQSQLGRERQDIRERIDTINRSLREIEFNPGRYIVLEPSPSTDAEVKEFQHDLRACTEGTLTGTEDDTYSEAKFVQVKKIIEKFRGREGYSEADKKWTRKVTDVRNWFSFSASERWGEDDKEHEYYPDSGGKSGGQKEKLAYTVLAASLAYQFGLEWGETQSRSFRFVVIDEAFGRGSDESAMYALELFRKLNLQLLVVTPLQKIHVIEPYAANVGFVHNPNGDRSKLRNLTIEEYRSEKAQREQ